MVLKLNFIDIHILTVKLTSLTASSTLDPHRLCLWKFFGSLLWRNWWYIKILIKILLYLILSQCQHRRKTSRWATLHFKKGRSIPGTRIWSSKCNGFFTVSSCRPFPAWCLVTFVGLEGGGLFQGPSGTPSPLDPFCIVLFRKPSHLSAWITYKS